MLLSFHLQSLIALKQELPVIPNAFAHVCREISQGQQSRVQPALVWGQVS